MVKGPEPIRGDDAEGAEKRLRRLHDRFAAVSQSADGARRRRALGQLALSPFETGLLIAALLFVGWGVGRAFGAW